MAVKISKDEGQEATIEVVESDDKLVITIPQHLKVAGRKTYKKDKETGQPTSEATGNVTIATSHGIAMLPSGCELNLSLFPQRCARDSH
jgi:hypothetical protein